MSENKHDDRGTENDAGVARLVQNRADGFSDKVKTPYEMARAILSLLNKAQKENPK